jgi:hypothetical protein
MYTALAMAVLAPGGLMHPTSPRAFAPFRSSVATAATIGVVAMGDD